MYHLLIIEDEAVIRAALRRLLERHGYQVSEAGSIDEAEDRLDHLVHVREAPRLRAVPEDGQRPAGEYDGDYWLAGCTDALHEFRLRARSGLKVSSGDSTIRARRPMRRAARENWDGASRPPSSGIKS